jgi:hypothetical protein
MKIFLFFTVLIISISCKSQNIYPLGTHTVPNGSYVKDLNNELDPYVGTWIANYNGKKITLYLTKEINRSFKQPDLVSTYFSDALIIKYSIDDFSSGLALHVADNFSSTDETSKDFISSFAVRSIGVKSYYTGTNCGVGYGEIILKLLNATQFNWRFQPWSSTLTTENCPGNPDLTVHLPITNTLVFTKQ